MYDLTNVKLLPGEILIRSYFENDDQDPGWLTNFVEVVEVRDSEILVKKISAFPEYGGKIETLPLKPSAEQSQRLKIDDLRLLNVDDVLELAGNFSFGARNKLAYYDLNAHRGEIERYIENMGMFLHRLIDYWQQRGQTLIKEAQLARE